VSFKVRDELFPAHKNILAVRSPVFRVEFYGPMRDEQNLRIVEDMQPTVFKGLLHFIYTDSFPAMDGLGAAEYEEMVRHLLVAAYVRHGKVEVYLREKAWPETFCADCGDHTSPC
jgi:speckle-type POZ protein